MSSGGNLLQMVFDGIWSTGEMIFKSFRKKEEEKAPLDIFLAKLVYVIKIKNILNWWRQ